MQKCGLRGQLTEQKGWVETYNMVEANKSVMGSIKNTKDFPQYSLANKKNEIINTMYDWEPMNKRSEYNNNLPNL